MNKAEKTTFAKAIKALKTSHADVFRTFLLSTRDTAAITTVAEGRFVDISDSMIELLGLPREQIIGRTTFDVGFWQHPKQREIMLRILKKKGRVRNLEINFVGHSGQIRTGLLQADAINLDGLPCLLAVTDDITERKKAEQALMESEEFLSNVLNNSPQPILVVNSDSSIRYINPKMEELTGFNSKTLIGAVPPYPWYVDKNNIKIGSNKTLSRLWSSRIEDVLYRRCDGTAFWVERHLNTIKKGRKNEYYLEAWVDITERKRLKENLVNYIHAITEFQEDERKRLSRAIHDQTIQDLARLMVDVDGILTIKDNMPEEARCSLEKLLNKIEQMIDEVRRIAHNLRPGLLDQFGLIPAVELLLDELKESMDIECHLEISGQCQLSSDYEVLLFRVIQEALQNVGKHSQASEVMVRIKFSTRNAILRIADNGIGFKVPKDLGNLVEKRRLGLLGIKERIALLKGDFRIESEPSKGTAVIVVIPV
ncbi:PAS domain S-box protein [Chloroflexota bacterium]